MKQKSAGIKMVTAMVIFGTIGLFVKNISLTSGEIAFYRAVLAVIAMLLYGVLHKQKVSRDNIKKDLKWLFLSGAAIGFNWILLFEAYKYTTISIATLSYYFAPVLVMLLCPLIFHEKLTKRQILCFTMATVGLILVILTPGEQSGSRAYLGVCFGLGAACLYASVILMNKKITHVLGIERTFIQFSAAAIVMLPYVLCTTGIHLSKIEFVDGINLLILGVLHTAIAYCLYLPNVKELSGQKVAILSYIDPMVAILVSTVFLHEKIIGIQILGGILIFFFTLFDQIKIERE